MPTAVTGSPAEAGESGRAARPAGRRPPPGLLAGAGLVTAVFAGPFAYLVVEAFALGFEELGGLLEPRILAPLARSLALATAVAVLSGALGLAAGWLVARTDLPGRRWWALLLALPLVIPSYIGAFTLQAAFATGGLVETVLSPVATVRFPRVEGFWAACAVLTLLTFPYVLLPAVARLRQVPASLEESARLLGRSGWASFRQVVWPQARAAVAGGMLLVFLYAISDFGAVQLLRYDTLTRVIFANVLDRSTSLLLSLQLGTLAVAVAATERLLTGRSRRGTLARGVRPLSVALGRWRVPALGFVTCLAVLALASPLAVLLYWFGRAVANPSGRAGSLAADPLALLGPLGHTALAGIAAATAAALVTLPVAYLVARYPGRAAAASNAIVVGGFALPGLVSALALVFFTLSAPGPFGALYQTLPLLVLAYVLHFGAQSLRTAAVGVSALPARLSESAQLLGATRLRRLVAVELPLVAPSILAGAGLVLLSTMKELPATLLLAPAGFDTLATRTWGATQDAFWADASVTALVLVALSGVLTWLLVLRRNDALA